MNITKNDKIMNKFLKISKVDEASIEFKLRKTDDTRNCLLEEIKHNDLMSQK